MLRTKIDSKKPITITHAGKMVFVKEGEWVYYRMGEDPDWQGPGKVMGQDGKLILIRHGRNYIVASPSRVMKTKPDFEFQQVTRQNDEIPNKQ